MLHRLAWLLLLGLWSTPCGAQGAPVPPTFRVTECPIDVAASPRPIDCGLLLVPEGGVDRDRVVTIPVAIVRAARPTLPPVVFLHGGPGGQGLSTLVERLKGPGAVDLIGSDQDWIFFDERGTGLSTPLLDCGRVALTDAGPASAHAVRALTTCGERHGASGVDLSRYNARAVAADVQALRTVIELDAIDLYGISYGTRVAFEIMRSNPTGVRAVVLDSVWPPEARWAEDTPPALSRAVRQVLRLCAGDRACSGRYPRLERGLDAMLAKWLRGSRPAGAAGLTPDDVASFLLDRIYDMAGTRALPVSVARMLAGDFKDVRAFGAGLGGDTEGQALAHLCREQFAFESVDATLANAAGDPIAEASALSAVRYFTVCRAFRVGVPDMADGNPVRSALPVLMLSAGIDAGCPSALGERALRHLEHGQWVVIPNITHGVLGNSACGRSLARTFLRRPLSLIDRTCLTQHGRFQLLLP